MLKKIILFVKVFSFLPLFIIVFQTCSDDDSPTETKQPTISGTIRYYDAPTD